jgi:hypothetical protein
MIFVGLVVQSSRSLKALSWMTVIAMLSKSLKLG